MGPSEDKVHRIHEDNQLKNDALSVDCGVSCVLTLDPKYSDAIGNQFFEPSALENAREITIMDTELEELPCCFTLHLVNVNALRLKRNKFKKLPPHLSRLIKLENLDLSHNCFDSLPQDFDLASLKCLNIASNNFKSVPSSVCYLQHLQNLNISMNDLNSLPDDLEHLKNLLSLNVSGNCLENLPESLSKLVKLDDLNASRNNLRNIPNSLSLIKSLRWLNISSNKLTEIPMCITSGLPQLSYLDLSHNKLVRLSHAPRCAHSLISLNVSHNNLQEIPLWLFEDSCRKLQNVDLSFNYDMSGTATQSVSALHGSCPLSCLNLSNCCLRLNTVSVLFGLGSLDSLHMGNKKAKSERHNLGNLFLVLPINVLSTCSYLRELHLPDVGLTDLPNSVELLAPHLEVLDVSHNGLHWLPDSFCRLQCLTHCQLSHNCLVLLPYEMGQLSNLRHLRVNSNMLESLPESMEQLSSLVLLDLFDNQLEYFPSFLERLSNLEALDLGSNCLNIQSCLEKISNEFSVTYDKLKTRLRFNVHAIERIDMCKPSPNVLDQYEVESSCSECGLSIGQDDSYDTSEKNNCCFSVKDSSKKDVGFPATDLTSEHLKCEQDEEWDSIDDPDSYFDPHVVTPKLPLQQPVFQMKEMFNNQFDDFCPKDLHPPTIGKRRRPQLSTAAENGQFDDAE